MNQDIYIMILKYIPLPVLSRVTATLGDAVFQHDNSPIHTARNVVHWLDLMNVDVHNHPPCSFCLNLIENVSAELDKEH